MKKIIFFLEFVTEAFRGYFKVFQKNNFETKVFKLEKRKSIIEKIRYLKEIISILKSFKPDFLYINDEVFSKNTFIIALIKKLFFKKAKIIAFIAQRDIPKNKTRKLKFLLENIDYLFCRNNKELGKIKKEKLFRDYISKVHRLYWGFPRQVFYRIEKTRKDICNSFGPLKNIYSEIEDKYVLGFIGRISAEKGLDLILNTLKKLPDDFVFLWAGRIDDNSYYDKLSDFIKKNNLSKRIIYLGYINNQDLRYIYNIIDLLILPTTKQRKPFLEELFGAVLAEGMLCKTLVIGSDNGAIPEVIRREDLIFKENNPDDLLRVIKYVYNFSLEEKEKEKNRIYNRAIREFSCEPFVQNIINVII